MLYRAEQSRAEQNGVVWCGVVSCRVVWCGVVWCSVVFKYVKRCKRRGLSVHTSINSAAGYTVGWLLDARNCCFAIRRMDRNDKISNTEDQAARSTQAGERSGRATQIQKTRWYGPGCQRNKDGKTLQTGMERRPRFHEALRKKRLCDISLEDEDYFQVISEARAKHSQGGMLGRTQSCVIALQRVESCRNVVQMQRRRTSGSHR